MLAPIGTNWVSGTLAGTPPSSRSVDGTNNAARFFHPGAITLGSSNEIYVADTDANTIREIDHVNGSWVTRTIAGAPGLAGSSDGTNAAALFSKPGGVAVGGPGVLYVADTGNDTIRRAQRDGSDWVTRTIAGLAGNYSRQDGTNESAHFDAPNAVAVGTPTNLFVSEYEAIRELTLLGTNWVSTTLAFQAAPISGIYADGLVIGQSGAVFAADEIATVDELVPGGNQWSFSAVAGLAGDYETVDGTNSDARFVRPNGICADTNGNFYLADQAVRKLVQIGTDWVVSTVGELPSLSGDLDWGPAANTAEYDGSFSIAVDNSGRLYVADTYNNVIRLGLPVPIITRISRTDSGTTLSWTSAPGLTYQVQFSDDPSAETWSNLGSGVTGRTESTTVTDTPIAGEQRFYRVALLP